MEQINEILIKINGLEKLVDYNQQNLVLTWSILGVIVATLALSGFVFIKDWVNRRVEKELKVIKSELRKDNIDFIKNNPPISFQKGLSGIVNLEVEENIAYNTINVGPLGHVEQKHLELPYVLEIYYMKDEKRILVDKYTIIRKQISASYDELVIRYQIPIDCLKLDRVYYNLIYFSHEYWGQTTGR